MCLVETRTYVSAEGEVQTVEQTRYCGNAQPGTLCNEVSHQTSRAHVKERKPIQASSTDNRAQIYRAERNQDSKDGQFFSKAKYARFSADEDVGDIPGSRDSGMSMKHESKDISRKLHIEENDADHEKTYRTRYSRPQSILQQAQYDTMNVRRTPTVAVHSRSSDAIIVREQQRLHREDLSVEEFEYGYPEDYLQRENGDYEIDLDRSRRDRVAKYRRDRSTTRDPHWSSGFSRPVSRRRYYGDREREVIVEQQRRTERQRADVERRLMAEESKRAELRRAELEREAIAKDREVTRSRHLEETDAANLRTPRDVMKDLRRREQARKVEIPREIQQGPGAKTVSIKALPAPDRLSEIGDRRTRARRLADQPPPAIRATSTKPGIYRETHDNTAAKSTELAYRSRNKAREATEGWKNKANTSKTIRPPPFPGSSDEDSALSGIDFEYDSSEHLSNDDASKKLDVHDLESQASTRRAEISQSIAHRPAPHRKVMSTMNILDEETLKRSMFSKEAPESTVVQRHNEAQLVQTIAQRHNEAQLVQTIAQRMCEQVKVEDITIETQDLFELMGIFAKMQLLSARSGADIAAATFFLNHGNAIILQFRDAAKGEQFRPEMSEPSTTLYRKIDSWIIEEAADLSSKKISSVVHSLNWLWLMNRIRLSTTMTAPDVKFLGRSSTLLTALDQTKKPDWLESRRFELDWDVNIYRYVRGLSINLTDEIVLVSDGSNVQAYICGDYISLVWPGIGRKVIDSINLTLRDTTQGEQWCKSVDGLNKNDMLMLLDEIDHNLRLCPSMSVGRLSITAEGPRALMLDLTELLGWLGSCMAIDADRLVHRSPVILSERQTGHTIHIKYSKSVRSLPEESSCWRALFRGSSIADGFPIAIRAHGQKGMEMSLGTMIALGNTEWATSWNDRLMLRGLTTMFYPVAEKGNELSWHFKHAVGDACLSHSEASDSCLQSGPLTAILANLNSMRHFVGWTPNVQSMIGADTREYALIREPTRTFQTAGLVLEKASIGASQYVSANVSIMKGRHAQPLWCATSNSYEAVLEFASNMPVVLYDTKARRGYITDGCNALLHLSLGRLWSPKARRFLDEEAKTAIAKFEYGSRQGGTGTVENAYRILNNAKNRALILRTTRQEEVEEIRENNRWKPQHKNKISYWRFEHLVVETWQYLHKIYDFQATPPSGIDIRFTDRDRLEGWSFKSIVDRVPLLQPKMVYLEPSGRGWNDFTRKAGAVTLMADGFGDILQDAVSVCPAWSGVPPQLDYLAASVSTLRDIYERNPAAHEFPSALDVNTFWHKPHLLFERCSANAGCARDGHSCDRLQVLLPSSWLGERTIPEDLAAYENGAVIFGHRSKHNFEWPVQGAPKQMFEKLKRVVRREKKLKSNTDEDVQPGAERPASGLQSPAVDLPVQHEIVQRLEDIALNSDPERDDLLSPSWSSESSKFQRMDSSSDDADRRRQPVSTDTSLSSSESTIASGNDSSADDNEAKYTLQDKKAGKQAISNKDNEASLAPRVQISDAGFPRTLRRKKPFKSARITDSTLSREGNARFDEKIND